MNDAVWRFLRVTLCMFIGALFAVLSAVPVFAHADDQASYPPVGTTAITVQVMPSGNASSDDSEPPISTSDELVVSPGQGDYEGSASLVQAESFSGDREGGVAGPLKTGDTFAAIALGASMCAFLGAAALVDAFRRRHEATGGSSRRFGGESAQ